MCQAERCLGGIQSADCFFVILPRKVSLIQHLVAKSSIVSHFGVVRRKCQSSIKMAEGSSKVLRDCCFVQPQIVVRPGLIWRQLDRSWRVLLEQQEQI